ERPGSSFNAVVSQTDDTWKVGVKPFGHDWHNDGRACWAQAGPGYPSNLVAVYDRPQPSAPAETAEAPGTDCVWTSDDEFVFALPMTTWPIAPDWLKTVPGPSRDGGSSAQLTIPALIRFDTTSSSLSLLSYLLAPEEAAGLASANETQKWAGLRVLAADDSFIASGDGLQPWLVRDGSAETILGVGDEVLAFVVQ
ncbi:MAG TPA: hypothetical protein VIT93_01795, partial [Dehalococcoidia bacterium]